MKGIYVLAEEAFRLIYGPDEQREIAEWADVYAPPQTCESIAENPEVLAEAEVLFSGWGAPVLDHTFLQAAPRLRAFFYGAGATGGLIHPEVWARGIVVTTASAANAVPVAEFTVAATVFALKSALSLCRQIHARREYSQHVEYGKGDSSPSAPPVAGAYGSTVGLVSLGTIGRAAAERLRAALHDVTLIAHDPFIDPAEARRFGVQELVGLDELFRRSDVVSLHTPWLPETEGMIRGRHIASMKRGATLINTARGAIIAQEEMVAVLADRPDLVALLDVSHPEPPPSGSPLYTLPNVFLTPHIAGSRDAECRRMGRYMVEELRRYCLGEPLRWAVRPETAHYTAHRVPAPK